MKGIDISTHQGNINWEAVKSQVDFAIIRCGYGDNIASQDDKQYTRNISECERLGIPYGVYLYSYALSANQIQSEIQHTLRLIQGHKPFCVYIDMEDNSTVKLGKGTLTQFAITYCDAIKAAGYKAGVYANQNWFRNYLDVKNLYDRGYSIWVAKYSSNKPDIASPYDIWQNASNGKVNGISGNVDMNIMYNDILNTFQYDGHLDGVDDNTICGWGYTNLAEVVDIHCYATNKATGVETFVGVGCTNCARPDVAAVHPDRPNAGFSIEPHWGNLGENSGTYVVHAFLINPSGTGNPCLPGELEYNYTYTPPAPEPTPEPEPTPTEEKKTLWDRLVEIFNAVINFLKNTKED